jgi:hypothetical protein
MKLVRKYLILWLTGQFPVCPYYRHSKRCGGCLREARCTVSEALLRSICYPDYDARSTRQVQWVVEDPQVNR